jgi:hypothetical protein
MRAATERQVRLRHLDLEQGPKKTQIRAGVNS